VIALLWNVVHLVRLHVLTLFLLMLKLIPLYPARQHSPGLQSTEEGTSLAATNMYKYLPQHTIVKIVFTRTCLACHFPTAEPGSRTSFVSHHFPSSSTTRSMPPSALVHVTEFLFSQLLCRTRAPCCQMWHTLWNTQCHNGIPSEPHLVHKLHDLRKRLAVCQRG
jgi:hypothetical protein